MPTNQTSIGIETDHTTGEAWPDAQLAALRIGTAAMLRHLGHHSGALHFHKTICSPPGRKSDPAGLELPGERGIVATLITGAPPALPAPVAAATSASADPARPPFPYKPGQVIDTGDKGDAVLRLQQRLEQVVPGFDYSTGPGIFGPRTDTAVRAFQRSKGLTVDGLVGPVTWAALWR